jgi:hypothetical protein
MRFSYVALAMFGLASIAGLAQSFGASPALGRIGPSRPAPHKLAAGHVYVLDYQNNQSSKVFRFPLSGGIVASQPDSTLFVTAVGGFFAVGLDGSLYVDAGQQILVYAPGAHGHDPPSRTIAVGPKILGRGALAVDANQYVYIAAGSGVQVIAPNGQTVGSISESTTSVYGLAVDQYGNLFVQLNFAGSDTRNAWFVYATPESSPTLIRQSCVGVHRSLLLDLAVDGNQVFLARVAHITRVPDTTNACPLAPYRYEISANVFPGMFWPMIAASGGHVFVVDRNTDFTSTRRLLELSESGGQNQTPIADVHYAGFVFPGTVAVGP